MGYECVWDVGGDGVGWGGGVVVIGGWGRGWWGGGGSGGFEFRVGLREECFFVGGCGWLGGGGGGDGGWGWWL